MDLLLEISFATGLAAVVASLAVVALGRAPRRLILGLAILLALAAAGAAVVAGLASVDAINASFEIALLAAGGLAAAAAAEAGLLGLLHGLRRLGEIGMPENPRCVQAWRKDSRGFRTCITGKTALGVWR